MNADEKVILAPAYHWVCPACGQSNWQLAVAGVASGEELKDHLVACGELDEWQEPPEGVGAAWFWAPQEVFCSRCSGQFPAIDWRAVSGEPGDGEYDSDGESGET